MRSLTRMKGKMLEWISAVEVSLGIYTLISIAGVQKWRHLLHLDSKIITLNQRAAAQSEHDSHLFAVGLTEISSQTRVWQLMGTQG